jgi:tetratricopeptide (TPR) repeat protein
MALFEAALEIEKRRGVAFHQPRYLSFYGLCVGIAAGRLAEGIRLCRQAVASEFYNPDLYWNLGRLLLAAGRRKQAYEAFVSGLRLEPRHLGLRRELDRMGRRRRPPLGFLPRSNPLNVWLGKLARAATARAGRPD